MDASGDHLDVPDCVPARMLNEYTYCPRLGYMEWVGGDFRDNYETVEGRFHHRVVDRETGRLPEAVESGDFSARSVWLSAPGEHLTARMDLLEGTAGEVTVVDYKRGAVPDNPERSWESDRIHLCAQALVLQENRYRCQEGILYYVTSKTRVPVRFTPELVERTRKLVSEFRNVAESGAIPPPLQDSPKCVRCSLAGVCLPDETNMLAGHMSCPDSDEALVRRLMPARDDSIPLYVQQQGAQIGKRGEAFEVTAKSEKLGEARIFETSQICTFGNVQVSTQALREMCSRDIPLVLFSNGGWFYGIAHGMSHKNVELRRAQYQTAADAGRCVRLATAMISTKIKNCRTLLMRNHHSLSQKISATLARLADRALKCSSIDSLLGIEGAGARVYFSELRGMIKDRGLADSDLEWRFDFSGRNRRPPLDPVNAMLSYAYGLLAKDLTVTVLAVGLDPFMGFYHRPRYGRPALALDIMEEFRPIVADSVVISVINNGVLTSDDFIRRGPAVALKDAARKKFIQAYERRLNSLVTHPIFGYRMSYRRVLEVQTRLLGRWLRGEVPEYTGFRTR